MLGIAPIDSCYVPKLGEVIEYDKLGDGTWITTHIGDGKTVIKDLPTLVNYDMYTRLSILEQKINDLQQRINNG